MLIFSANLRKSVRFLPICELRVIAFLSKANNTLKYPYNKAAPDTTLALTLLV